MAVSANRLELLQIADAVAREKMIDRDDRHRGDGGRDPARRARSRYGAETRHPRQDRPARPASSACSALRRGGRGAVENYFDRGHARGRAEAATRRAQVGDFIVDPLPPIEFGRIAAQTAKQVIVQKVRDAERERQYEEFKDRVGEIINGVVKRVEYGNVIVDLGRGEGDHAPRPADPARDLPLGDRIRAYIYDVRRETRGPQIFLSPRPPALHGQAVRAGSAGDLRRHHRDQGRRPRSRQPRQDRP